MLDRTDKSGANRGALGWWKHKRPWGKRVVGKRSRKLAKGEVRKEFAGG